VFDKPGPRPPGVAKSRKSGLTFVLVFFAVLTASFVAIGGWRGLIIAPLLILWAVAMALRHRRPRGAVGALMNAGDRDFDRMRREGVARRRVRDDRSR
jgi:hypothetical protein